MATMLERARSAGIPVHSFDLEGDERWGVDPHEMWDAAGSVAPLFYSPVNRGFFVAADYDTVKAVLQAPAVWSSSPTEMAFTKERVTLHVPPLSMDPPEHTGYRKALIPLFAPNQLISLEPRIRELCHELIDGIFDKRSCDVTRDFASQLPSRFFLGWMGFEGGDMQRMFELAEKAAFDFPTAEARRAIEEEIEGLIGQLFELRRREPRDDLATALVNLRVDGEQIAEPTLLGIGSLTFIAGQETTSTQLAYVLYHLATHPEDRRSIVSDPTLIPSALEELTRVYNTGGSNTRVAKQAGTLNGVEIEPGDRIFLARAAADRRLAEGIQLDRSPNRHTAFGLGVHRCIGSHVARVEMRIALEVWHERIPEYSVTPGWVPSHRYGSFMQQLHNLPLRFPGLTDQ
ncbi:cytochrome P450 [Nocardia miyunensis]|uniref:cytochrome P450 n=1 Tax=Nocardia miyunensis TaxID=282684 RepID=UPI00082A2312|nr:cytochrome P450 [Nocardia miyunensis]